MNSLLSQCGCQQRQDFIKIADDAVTVVRDNHRVMPLPRAYHSTVPAGNRLLVLVFTGDVRGEEKGREKTRAELIELRVD